MTCGPRGPRTAAIALSPARMADYGHWLIALLHRFALANAVLQELQIGLHVGIGRILGQRLAQRAVGAGVVAAQHVGEALIVEDFDRRADEAERFAIGAVGKIEAAQPVVSRRQSDPGFGVARAFFDRRAEAFFGEAETVGAEIFLAERNVVIGIVTGETRRRERRDRLAARPRLGGRRHDGARGVRARGAAVGRSGVAELG